jgi:hypothetical protein
MTTDIFCFYLQNRLIQTSQTGGQWYSDTSPFSIPWSNRCRTLAGSLNLHPPYVTAGKVCVEQAPGFGGKTVKPVNNKAIQLFYDKTMFRLLIEQLETRNFLVMAD